MRNIPYCKIRGGCDCNENIIIYGNCRRESFALLKWQRIYTIIVRLPRAVLLYPKSEEWSLFVTVMVNHMIFMGTTRIFLLTTLTKDLLPFLPHLLVLAEQLRIHEAKQMNCGVRTNIQDIRWLTDFG